MFDRSNQKGLTLDNGTTWLVLALFIGVCVRGYFLAQPMRYDESYTFLNFVLPQDLRYVFYYPAPNNHVLHSILVRASVAIWGAHPVSIRFVAFTAGFLSIPLVYILCRRQEQSGIFAAITFAIFPYFVLYSTNARGYTLVVLFTLILVFLGRKIMSQLSKSQAHLFSLVISLGLLIMPSMLFPVAGVYLWVLLSFLIERRYGYRQVFYEFIVPSVIITSTLTVLFYTPVVAISGIQSIIANRFVVAQPWGEFVSEIPPHFHVTFVSFTRDIPILFLLMGAILFVIGIYSAVKQRRWSTLLLFPSVLFASGIIFVMNHRIPFPRTWIYIIPFFILLADAGFTYISALFSIRVQSFLNITIFTAFFFIAVSMMSQNTIAAPRAFVEAEMVVEYLKPIMSTNDSIHMKTPVDWPVNFYLWYHDVPQLKANINSAPVREYYVVMKSRYSIDEMTEKQYIILWDVGELVLYRSVDQ